jgi:hypothetical protein
MNVFDFIHVLREQPVNYLKDRLEDRFLGLRDPSVIYDLMRECDT